MTSKLIEKLNEPEYRKAFVASQINVGIPFQIRALLKSRPGWTQTTLAEKAEMRQPSISALLTPGKTRPNIETLRRIANVFDCGLIVRFAPFSELAKWSEDFDPESFSVPSFDEESHGNAEVEKSDKVAEARPVLPLAGLTSSPEDRDRCSEILRTYEFYRGQHGGLVNPYGDLNTSLAGAVAITTSMSVQQPELQKKNNVVMFINDHGKRKGMLSASVLPTQLDAKRA